MKNKITKLFIVLMLSGYAANAQTESQLEFIKENSNVIELNNIAKERLERSESNRKKAEEIAKAKGLPLSKLDKETGEYYEVYTYSPLDNEVFYRKTFNNSPNGGSIQTIKVGYLHSIDIKGQNMLIGEWDGGIAHSTHTAFGGRVQVRNTPGSVTSNGTFHATHVAGTMIASENAGEPGKVGQAKGMAPMAALASWNWQNDDSEMAAAAGQGLVVSNHSYGLDNVALNSSIGVRIFGRYTGNYTKTNFGIGTSKDLDLILNAAPYYTSVWAAGNDRNLSPAQGGPLNNNFGGRDLLVNEGTAKNNIVVAAVNGVQTYSSPSSVVMSDFSNWGPTDDFRIKPDISAKGVAVYSTSDSGNNGYAIAQGTSMAAPSITGAISLWQQLYSTKNNNTFMRSSTVRALMAHTAMEAGGQVGPDYMYGWGLFNSEGGALVIENNSGVTKTSLIEENQLMQGQFYEFDFNKEVAGDITATIAWNDPAGEETTNTTANFFHVALVNDLDIKVINVDNNTEYFPYRLKNNWASMQAGSSNEQGDNTVDNIEKIYIPSAPVGNYKVRVNHKGTLKAGSQIYSLILTGHGGPLSVEQKYLEKLNVYPNPFNDYVIINNSQDVLLGASVNIYDISGKLIVSKNIDTPDNYKIDTSFMSNGVYILNIDIKGASKSFKIVK